MSPAHEHRRCEVCGVEYQQDFVRMISQDNEEKWFCKVHSDELFIWIEKQRKEGEFEETKLPSEKNDRTQYVILPLAGLLIIIVAVYRFMHPQLSVEDALLIKILLFLLSITYIAAYCSPSIYPQILRIGHLKKISLRYDRRIKMTDIMQIDATVIVGSLFFLSLSSIGSEHLLPSVTLSSLLGINPQELFSLITTTIVAIFAFSAIATCIVKELEVGRRLMVGGFVYLFFMIFLIAL